jgi:hypothetical protein
LFGFLSGRERITLPGLFDPSSLPAIALIFGEAFAVSNEHRKTIVILDAIFRMNQDFRVVFIL